MLFRSLHFKKIPEFWNECQRNGSFSKLISIDTATPKGIFGVFGAYDEQLNEIAYSMMAISDQEPPQGYTEMNIPNATSRSVGCWCRCVNIKYLCHIQNQML